MSPSRRSSVSSISSESVENECFNYVVSKLHKYQPLSLQGLVGHLSAMPSNLRNFIGTTNIDVKKFLESYPDAFAFNEKGRVCLLKHPKDLEVGKRHCGNSNSHVNSVFNARGQITRLFPTYGFLKCTTPVNASVYFSSACFGDIKRKILHDYCLRIGQTLAFDAKLGSAQASAEYQATRIWFPPSEEEDEEEQPRESYTRYNKKPSGASKHFKDRIFTEQRREKKRKETNLNVHEDACEGAVGKRSLGYIQNIFSHYGFIEEEKNGGNRVFFHKNSIRNANKVGDLCEVLKKGDGVRFISIKSTKKQDRWEATDVWLMKGSAAVASSDEEIYVSSPEFSGDDDTVGDNAHCEPSAKKKSKAAQHDRSLSSLSNCTGKIYPNTEASAEIKFGDSHENVAVAEIETCEFYQKSEKVVDLMWEFHEGDKVQFDAVRMERKNGGDAIWKAVLVWVGKKPDVHNSLVESHSIGEGSDSVENFQPEDECTADISVETHDVCSDGNGYDDADTASAALPEYASWGDSPFMEDSLQEKGKKEKDVLLMDTEDMIPAQDDDDDDNFSAQSSHRCRSDSHHSSHSNDSYEKEIEGVLEDSVNPNEQDLDVENNENFSKEPTQNKSNSLLEDNSQNDSFKEYEKIDNIAEPDVAACEVENNDSRSSRPSGVHMFEDLSGTIVKMSRYYIAEVTCPSLERPVSIFVNVLFYDGVPIKDKCSDLRELLSEGEKINFNCYEIIDDQGEHWLKATLAWRGNKPSETHDFEPSEFIEKENLHVSGEIPTWKQFRRRMTDRKANMSKRSLMTDENVNRSQEQSFSPVARKYPATSSRGKFLTAVYMSSDDEECHNDTNTITEQQQLQQPPNTVPEIPELMEGLMRKLNKLRQYCTSYDALQDFDDVSSDIQAAVNMKISHIHTNAANCYMVDKQCQTDPHPGNLPSRHSQRQRMPSRDLPSGHLCTTGVQTLVTGDIIIRDIFPH